MGMRETGLDRGFFSQGRFLVSTRVLNGAVLEWDFRGGARVWLDGWLSVGWMDGVWDGEGKGKRQCECGGWVSLARRRRIGEWRCARGLGLPAGVMPLKVRYSMYSDMVLYVPYSSKEKFYLFGFPFPFWHFNFT